LPDLFSVSSLQHGWLVLLLGAVACSIALLTLLRARGGEAMPGPLQASSDRSSLSRLNDAVDAIPQALAIFDADDRCVSWNSRYAELNRECAHKLAPGVTFRELLRAGLEAGHYPEAAGREGAWLEERLNRRRGAPSQIEQLNSDGRWLRIEDRRMADGGTVSVCVDITDLKRNALALARARDDAQSANRAKSEFLANMSHEIRTPLNGVVGVADVLARTELRAEQREMVEMVRSSAVQLERLLSDVLDLARIESGQVEIRPEPFHLGDAARQTVALYRAIATDKGVGLVLDLTPEADRMVQGDVVRIKQILGNLVSNAVKFTAEGEVRLTIRRMGGWWRCEVKDSGIGFEPGQKERLFGRFQQADGSVTRRYGGTGLGLAICRQLAELMGAELDAESTPGEGATFFLVVDLPDAESAGAEAAAALAADAAEARELRVLLADDHPTNRKVVELILAQAGVQLTMVENGREAVDAFEQGEFDVVLMDMQMPVMDGVTATRAIRALEAAEGRVTTPILMLTANALPEHIAEGRAAGAQGHLSKPIGAPALLAALLEIADGADGAGRDEASAAA
jgi:signal transduction histidine kinase/ActR/RegA family two-component response regulator